MAMEIEEVLAHFDGVVPCGEGWKALCPCHGDVVPSLSIDWGDKGNILVNCLSGCPTDGVIQEVGLTFADLSGHGPRAAPRVKREVSREDRELRAEVYAALIQRLGLSDTHRTALRRRGLSPEAIDVARYRTLDFLPVKVALKALHAEYGEDLFKVPGIADESGKPRLIHDSGLLIPVRDLDGRIQGCQVRVGEANRKYVWMSCKTARSGSPCHMSRLGLYLSPEWWVTEGPLKADVAAHLGSHNFLGTGGASMAKSAKAALDQIARVDRVVLAFDMDRESNDGVLEKMNDLGLALKADGYEVAVASWDAEYKGIDDALLRGVVVKVNPF